MMKDFSKLILGIAVVLLGLLSMFLWVQNKKLTEQSNVYLSEKTSINEDYDQLQVEFDELSIQLGALEQAKNDQITAQQKELEEKKVKISRLLRKERLTRTELEQAKGMIEELRNETNQLLSRVKELNAENVTLKEQNKNYQITLKDVGQKNKALTTANQSLTQEKEVLVAQKQEITNQKTIVEEQKATIEQEKAKVEQQKQTLEEQQQKNAPKVKYAELLKINDLTVQGLKYKNNGSERETKNFKKVDKLAITFNAGNNPVATNGTKEFLVRIINPDGTVMYDKQRGSGEFSNNKDEGMKYTTKTAIDYQAKQKNVTLFWRQDLPYQKGNYAVQVYQDGFQVANGNFELKSGL